jgi:AraC-like DNA-binding protein
MVFHAFTALVRSAPTVWLFNPILDGRVQSAAAQAQEFLDDPQRCEASDATTDIAVLCGDLMLTQDRDEEAEECYRRALKSGASGPRGLIRVLSRRNTGMMSLYQQRFGTAASCFRRVVEDEDAGNAQKVEALCGLALAHHGMGQMSQALNSLDRAAELADTVAASYLVMLVSVLRADLLVQQEIRTHGELHDHVFWQVPAQAAASTEAQLHPLAAVKACLGAYSAYPLIANRLQHLQGLVLATCGDVLALRRSQEHLAWLRRSHLDAGLRQARVEVALVAITARNVEVARSVLEPLTGRSDGGRQRWNLELPYCLAKICAMSGRTDDSLKHYQRYALESVQCVRAETADPINGPQATAQRSQSAKDDVEMSLPAKYRRAYRYLIEHLDNASLSVREIAEEIGVTERALQSVFKAHLGMTPAEVVRRCRVERIRHDLLHGDATGATVIETASRWGIRNRSTLVSLYRKYFHETPAQTLSRSEPGEPHDELAAAA